MKVLITGATGFLGSYIVDKCIEQGDSVRVLVRKTSNIDYLKKYPDIEYAYGDLTDLASLRNATKGIDAVYIQRRASRPKVIVLSFIMTMFYQPAA